MNKMNTANKKIYKELRYTLLSMDAVDHTMFVQEIIENPDKLKELLEADRALANMIYDMIKKIH